MSRLQVQYGYGVWGGGYVRLCDLALTDAAPDPEADDLRSSRRFSRAGAAGGGKCQISKTTIQKKNPKLV